MRYLLTGHSPPPAAVLLVESGSRTLLEGLIPGLRAAWCGGAPLDLATCFPGLPRGLEDTPARVYRLNVRRGFGGRMRLLRELAANRYTHVGIVCSGEPYLARWKWALALALPAKVFVVNENGDYFWLDRRHLRIIGRFAADRWGLADAGAARTLGRAVAFPFALAYLLLYAAAVHARRAFRLMWRAHRA